MTKVQFLVFYELKLLLRSRGRLLPVLCMPLLGGLLLGLAGRHAAPPTGSCGIFLVLPASSLFLALGSGICARASDLMPVEGTNPAGRYRVARASWAAAALFVLMAQAALYAGLVSAVSAGPGPGIHIVILSIALSLALGLTALRLRRDA